MWLVLVPIVVLMLCFMAFSLFAGLFWVVGGAWPWLLIGLGAWLFWHDDGRHYRRRARASWMGRSIQSAQNAPPGRAWSKSTASVAPKAASRAEKRSEPPPELPIDVQVKVEQIRRKVEVLLGYADRFPPFSQDLYLVRQTASDYLPRTISTFLGLSKEAADAPLHPGGKTARQELKSQLELLDSKLDEIAQDLQRQDADRLLANRRFLETRFGERGGEPPAKDGAA
jgi:hypothetical protein